MTTPYTPQTWDNGPAGGTPISASRLNHMEAGIQGAGAFFNVKTFGAVGDGVADDTAAIQAAINAADAGPDGAVVWFPAGVYLVSATIVFPGRITLMGGGGIGVGTTIRAAAGLTDAVLASAAWFNNATTCDTPVRIQGLQIDGNNVGTGVRGLVMLNFHSRVEDVQVRNTTGHGIEVNDTTRNGTNTITNSCSEPTIVECRFDTIGGDGIHQESNNLIANLDGRVLGCFFATIAGHSVNIGRAAGWAIETNHFYGTGLDAIRAANCYATVIRGNYVEDFGTADLAGATYTGINLTTVLNSRASVVVGNTVSTEQPSSPTATRFVCYNARAGTGQMRAIVVMAGNTAMFASNTAPAVARSHAYRLGQGADTGRLLQVEWAGNQIENTIWWELTRFVAAATVDLREPGRSGVVTLTDAATVALDAARGKVFKLVAADNRTISAPTNGVDGQGLIIAHTASGGARTLTLTTGVANGFAFGTDVTGLTATVSGTTDYIGAIYDATSQRWRVVSVARGY